MLGGPSAGLLVITAAWTGCRWGELAGLQRDHVHPDRSVIVIDPEIGALHESTHGLWLGPPKTPASARTITLPPFLAELLHDHLATTPGMFVFTSPLGYRLRRSTFDRRVFRPAVDGSLRKGTHPIRPGLTFHGLRHSHKTWLIADHIPEIAQARRLGHHLSNRLAEVYSHVAPEIETELLKNLERRWYHAHQTRRPTDNRPRRKPPTPRSAPHAPHSAPALRTTSERRRQQARPRPTRIHDLRHSFAVATLLGWYHDGGDVQARLPLLSAALGHSHPNSTYWYLQAAPELLALAAARLEPFAEVS